MDTKRQLVDKLQKDILLWQGVKSHESIANETMGLGDLEAAFPNGVFPRAAIHEIINAEPEHAAACAGFISGLLKSLMNKGGSCLWISTSKTFFPPSLIRYGVAPDRIIFIDVLERVSKLKTIGCIWL